MNFVMAVQQGCAFWAKDRAVLALSTIIFALAFFTVAFDLMHLNHNLIGHQARGVIVCARHPSENRSRQWLRRLTTTPT